MVRFFLYFFLIFSPFFNVFPMFSRVEGVEASRIRRVAVSPLNQNLLYVASKTALFKSGDAGTNFEKISVFKDEKIQHIFFDEYLADTLYLATTRYIFKITDRVEKIFSARENETILTAAKLGGEIFAGTNHGAYFTAEDTLNWQRIKGLREGVSVYSFAARSDKVYFSANKGIYFFKEDKIKKVFSCRELEEKEETENDEENTGEDEEETVFESNIIKGDIFDENKIWLGTHRGIFFSKDSGDSWDKLCIEGTDNLNIYSLAQTKLSENTLYAGAAQGFFKLDLKFKTCQQIFEGLYAREVLWVEFNAAEKIYLATPKGLFQSSYFTPAYKPQSLEEMLANEPSILEIQQATLRYNEVHPEKIEKWRRKLKVRAFFPEVSLDYDKTVTTALGATYDRVQVGPQDWGVNLKWDVGDLIWNTYEDDIDSKARLNTQLRLDVLDEINRLYFARLRLKREMLNSSLEEEELFQKKLRLSELNAMIDGYTGGDFSKNGGDCE